MLWHESSEETPLQVTCEWPYVPSNGNGDWKTMKMLLNCFACPLLIGLTLSSHRILYPLLTLIPWHVCTSLYDSVQFLPSSHSFWSCCHLTGFVKFLTISHWFSCLPMVGDSLQVLRLLPPLKLVTMIYMYM